MRKSCKRTVVAVGLCAVALSCGLAACANGGSGSAASAPEPDQFGVITAEAWSQTYPNEYATYMMNEANSPESGKMNYLEEYPALNTMYKGYGFAKGYDEAASHNYTLQSILETPRVNEKTLANCITCKTPQFTAMVNSQGDEVYAMPFADLISQFDEPISCYNCHENDPETVTFTNGFYANSLGDSASTTPVEAQSCGQCHNEYYFDPDTKATTNPYSGTDAMTAEAMLAYYNELGFSDWEHPDTGAKMLKAQHPEFETIYGGTGSRMAAQGYSCADCHMAPAVDDEGNEYVSHQLVKPTENDAIMEKCQPCHADLAGQVAQWQDEITAREHAISDEIERYIDELAAKKDSLSADDLARAQQIHREAQWYWDYVMVENSEGAHNPSAANANLDKDEQLLEEGFKILGA